MLIAGLLAGFLLGVVVSIALWATGRRPYLRVDISQHRTTRVVHHGHGPESAAPIVDGHIVAPPALPDPSRRRAVPAITRVVREHHR